MKYFKFIIELCIILYFDFIRFIKESLTKFRYKKELNGKNGMRVTGIWSYPGQFKSKEQIIELCNELKSKKSLTINVPWKKDSFYSNQFKIIANENNGFDIELLEAGSQSYLYLKSITKEQLKETILSIQEQCDNPEQSGYQIEYF